MTFCYAMGLFYDIFECAMYYSYCIQGFYRLCRIVFYKKKYLVAQSLYIGLIIGQWILVFGLLLPPILMQWYIRLPTERYCLIPYTNIAAEIYHIMFLYIIPVLCIGISYGWITIFMRQKSQTSLVVAAVNRRHRNERDLVIIKRIILLVFILVLLRFPTIGLMIYGVMAQDLYPLTYGIIGIFTAVCLGSIGISTIYVTPQLRKQFLNTFIHLRNRIHIGQTPMNQTGPTTATIETIQMTKRTNHSDVTSVLQNN
ncbi:unnamed protein product [Rotaria sordida]|uniref:G-protein coupled receptors family 1 profile domain-containing protein n=1 Tax=Rotaria sordida TaxID=392033 RepID=A0A816CA48_9BILA|nr:unnamed protein product [Rotaria sordida]CAF1620203.1 unnamed protein product [Rotaria sordida]